MKTILVSITVQRLVRDERFFHDDYKGDGSMTWRDDGQLAVDLTFDPDNSDWATNLGADVGTMLYDYLLTGAASKGIYRLGTHENAPVYKYASSNDGIGELVLFV